MKDENQPPLSEDEKQYDLFHTPEAAALYSQHQPPLSQKVVELVLNSTAGRDLLVDVGCGSGSSTRPFAAHFTRVAGVDYSAEQLALARTLDSDSANISYHEGSVYSLPFPDSSADCVFGVMIAQFLDLPRFYAEVSRVLAPGGSLLFYGKSSIRAAKVESTHSVSSSDVNERIVNIKTKLFKGLWHDRTHFNPMKYQNMPQLYADFTRQEFVVQRKTTLRDVSDHMMTWSASLKYCKREGITYAKLHDMLCGMLRGGGEDGEEVKILFEYDNFTYCTVKPTS